jgi:hypothetical protein
MCNIGVIRAIDVKIMFLDGVIGRRGIAVQLCPFSLAKNNILTSIISNWHM